MSLPIPVLYRTVLDALNHSDSSIHLAYSGSDMNGETCFGVVGDSVYIDLMHGIERTNPVLARSLAAAHRQESLESDTIHYFPGHVMV